jgi:pimeloyl-ACP methyl ester carboxylesterase
VLLRNTRFHYLDWGGPGTTPIVFLHGGGLTAHTWDLVALALRDRYRCYAPDARGHGDSEWIANMDYSTDEHAADVHALVQTLALDRPVIVGMSMGGSAAVRYSIEHTPRALVVIDTGPVIDRKGGQPIIDFIRQPAELDSVDDFVERAMKFNPRRNPTLLRRSLLHNLVQLPDGKWTWKYDKRHWGRVPEQKQMEQRAALWKDIERITCPTQVVRGAESLVFPRESAESFAKRLPRGRWVEVPNAGHTVQGDNPSALAAAMIEFLGGLED